MDQAGDSKSGFSKEALKHLDALYGFALTLTRDRIEAEDLVQETYLRSVRALGQLRPESNLKSWLFVIMKNAWLNQLRHQRNGPRFVGLDEEKEDSRRRIYRDGENPHVVYLRKLERTELRAAIESLPDQYREIVVLREIEGFSYQQIAEILNCPAGTVMSRLNRARGQLRKLLTSYPNAKAAKA